MDTLIAQHRRKNIIQLWCKEKKNEGRRRRPRRKSGREEKKWSETNGIVFSAVSTATPEMVWAERVRCILTNYYYYFCWCTCFLLLPHATRIKHISTWFFISRCLVSIERAILNASNFECGINGVDCVRSSAILFYSSANDWSARCVYVCVNVLKTLYSEWIGRAKNKQKLKKKKNECEFTFGMNGERK